MLSSNSVTLLIEILVTSALRWCVGVAVRGSVWLVVVLVVVLWVLLCVELKESNAHAHRCNAKKQTISHTGINKKSTPTHRHTQRICSPYIVKNPFNTLFSGSFVRPHARHTGETVSLCISYTPSDFSLKYLPFVLPFVWHD